MTKTISTVDSRTQLVGKNRLEILTFHLNSDQLFGINVFKVQEVMRCPEITLLPNAHPNVVGVAHIRGVTIAIIDLSKSIGLPPVKDIKKSFMIVAEYNRSVHGFLVENVETIFNLNWEEVTPPPKSGGQNHFLTAVTRVRNKITSIIDVERVLSDINPQQGHSLTVDELDNKILKHAHKWETLIVDDSHIALKQLSGNLTKLGIPYISTNNGKQAWDLLCSWRDSKMIDVQKKLLMVITDAEMPKMDGYTLISNMNADPVLKNIKTMLHTSLSGDFNKSMVEKVGANYFMSKFNSEELLLKLREIVEERSVAEGLS